MARVALAVRLQVFSMLRGKQHFADTFWSKNVTLLFAVQSIESVHCPLLLPSSGDSVMFSSYVPHNVRTRHDVGSCMLKDDWHVLMLSCGRL